MLSDLQLRVARIIAGLIEAEDFALAGGAALIVRGEVERATRDLDFFGTSPDAVDHLVPAAELALQQAGFQVDRLIDSPGFTRLVVADELERTEVDLASDARLFPTETGPGFDLLSSEELAADKVLAVFGRAEARDYVDRMSIEPRFGRLQRWKCMCFDGRSGSLRRNHQLFSAACERSPGAESDGPSQPRNRHRCRR